MGPELADYRHQPVASYPLRYGRSPARLLPVDVGEREAARQTARQQVYASLTGSSSALLGLALAAVAILAAFGPRPAHAREQARDEARLARARANLIGALLAASFFLLIVLIIATVALAVDAKAAGNSAVAALIESAGAASVAGLVISGLGLALVIAERSRH